MKPRVHPDGQPGDTFQITMWVGGREWSLNLRKRSTAAGQSAREEGIMYAEAESRGRRSLCREFLVGPWPTAGAHVHRERLPTPSQEPVLSLHGEWRHCWSHDGVPSQSE